MATLSENIFINAKIGGSRGNYVITPKIPDGLAAAVESLTREVIRHHPPDIYVFAAQHFSNLLQLRDQNYPKINRHHSQPIIYDSSSSSVSSSCHQVTRESPSEWQQCHHYHQQKTSKRSKPNYYSQYERTRDFPVVITEHHHHHHHHQRRKSRDIKSQSPNVISNDEMLAKDIKTKLKKNRISSRERSESMRSNKAVTTSMTNLSMNKVKDYVVNKFSHSSSFDEPPNYYVSKVQDVITATEPIINEKLKVFRETKSLSRQSTHSQTQDLPENNLNINSNALEARLNETHNILKDISSCFSMRSNKNRPHSADFVAGVARRRKYHEATDELEAMLHETHNLLQGISSSLLKENNLRKFKQEDHLPSVQNTAVKDAVKVCDNKSLFGSFALPPVVTTGSSSSSVANDDQIFKIEKVKQDLTLPVLIPAVVDNSCDIEEQMKGDDTEAKNEAKDEAKNETKAKNEAEAKKKEIKEETCYILTEDNDKSKIPSNITTVIISDQVRSNNDQEIQSDPLLDSFGEVIVAQPIESAISINDLVDPDDLMMKNKVRVIKQDLQCINEEEGGEDSPSSRTETGEQENQVEIESDHELKFIDYQKEEMTSSVKETSVETDLGSPKSLDGRGETEQSSGDGGDVGESITADLAESSSNEAKETTVTDNCTTEPLIQSLSLDEPVRPFVPELNLDSLQDITVSSFKLTPTDDESEQPEDNEISNTLIESADFFTTATVDNSSEKIEDVCSLQVVETDKSDKDGEEISLEVEKVSGGFNETEKVDEVLEEYSDKEDKQEPDGENDMAKLNRALIVIQAAIRGFLARRRRRQLEKIKEDNLISSILLAEDTTMIDDEDVRQPLVIVEIDAAESLSESQDKIEEETQENFLQSRDLRKRLHRENAMQKTTTMSTETSPLDIPNNEQDYGLQHTGEFHDCIVLPADGFDSLMNSTFYRRHPRYAGKNTSEDPKEDHDQDENDDSSDDNQVLKNWTQDGHKTVTDCHDDQQINNHINHGNTDTGKFTASSSVIILSNTTPIVPPTIGFPLFDFGLNPLTQSHMPGIYNYNYVDNDLGANINNINNNNNNNNNNNIASSPTSLDNDSLSNEGVIITEEINEPEEDNQVEIIKEEIKCNGVNKITQELEEHQNNKPFKLLNGKKNDQVLKCDLGNLSSIFDQSLLNPLGRPIPTNVPLASPVSIKLLENNLLNVVFGNGSSIPITLVQNIPTKESLLHTNGNHHHEDDEVKNNLS